jgi:hypothetical protein
MGVQVSIADSAAMNYKSNMCLFLFVWGCSIPTALILTALGTWISACFYEELGNFGVAIKRGHRESCAATLHQNDEGERCSGLKRNKYANSSRVGGEEGCCKAVHTYTHTYIQLQLTSTSFFKLTSAPAWSKSSTIAVKPILEACMSAVKFSWVQVSQIRCQRKQREKKGGGCGEVR